MTKTRFKGHETFYFRDGWISKALFELNNSNECKLLTDVKFGISKLGVGSNMVKSIKYWLLASGLVEYKNSKDGYQLTELGRLIANNDIYFEDEFTLWLIHFHIATNKSLATTWYIFWNYFNGDSFSSKQVESFIKHYLENENITFNDKSLESDVSVLLQMYSKRLTNDDPEENIICPLSRLSLITKKMDKYFISNNGLNSEHKLVPLFIITMSKDEDDELYLSKGYIKRQDAELLLSRYMNANRLMANEYLSFLEEKYIRIENTAGLDMIYFTNDLDMKLEIKEYYERRL